MSDMKERFKEYLENKIIDLCLTCEDKRRHAGESSVVHKYLIARHPELKFRIRKNHGDITYLINDPGMKFYYKLKLAKFYTMG
jgi:hypothetical protein